MVHTDLHVFYSHSWITQLVIESYIKKVKIPQDEILILSNRNFHESLDPFLQEKFKNIRKIKFPNWLHAILSKYKINKFYSWFKNITTDKDFIFYVPHFHPIEVKIITQHPKCKSIYLIEEGELSYRTQDYINNLQNHHHKELKKKYLDFFWDKKLSKSLEIETIDHDIISGTLQIFKDAFPYSANKIVLIDDIRELVINIMPSPGNLKNILVLTPYVDVLELNPEIYFNDLEKVMHYIAENTEDIIHYKFHPNDSEFVRQRTNQLAEKFGDQFVRLSDSISLEAILLKSKPTVYSFISSITIYAFLLECKLNIMSDFIHFRRPDLIINDINLSSFVIQSNKI